MQIAVYQTILCGTLTVDEDKVLAALNDGDNFIVEDFIARNESQLTGAEVQSQTWSIV